MAFRSHLTSIHYFSLLQQQSVRPVLVPICTKEKVFFNATKARIFSQHACKLSHHQADGYIRHKHGEGFSLLVKVWKIHFLFETKHTLGGHWGLQGIPYYLGQLQLSQFLDIKDKLKNYIENNVHYSISFFSEPKNITKQPIQNNI